MSERRALEFNYIKKIKGEFIGSNYDVVESNTYEERKIPCIIVVVGDSKPMIDHPEAQDNFESDLDIIVMSSADEPSPDEHMNVCDKVRSVVLDRIKKRLTEVKYLHIYNVLYQGVTDLRQERRLGTQIKFQVHYYYNMNPNDSQ
jgi:hypothetical protein